MVSLVSVLVVACGIDVCAVNLPNEYVSAVNFPNEYEWPRPHQAQGFRRARGAGAGGGAYATDLAGPGPRRAAAATGGDTTDLAGPGPVAAGAYATDLTGPGPSSGGALNRAAAPSYTAQLPVHKAAANRAGAPSFTAQAPVRKAAAAPGSSLPVHKAAASTFDPLSMVLSQLQDQKTDIETRLAAEKTKTGELELGMMKLEEELKNANEGKDIKNAKQFLAAAQKKNWTGMEQLSRAKDQTEATLGPIMSNLKAQEDEAERLQKYGAYLPQLQASIDSDAASNKKTMDKVTAMQAESKRVSGRIAVLKSKHHQLFAQYSPIREEYLKFHDLVRNHTADVEILKSQVKNLVVDKDGVEKRLKQINVKHQELLIALDELNSNSTTLNDKIEQLQSQLLEVTTEREKLRASRKGFKDNLSDAGQATRVLQHKRETLNAQLRNSMPQITSLTAENTDLEKQIANVKNSIATLQEAKKQDAAGVSAVVNKAADEIEASLKSAEAVVDKEMKELMDAHLKADEVGV